LRLSTLKQLICSLERYGISNIHIIDNASSYQPLLDYYEEECKYEVIYLNENMGPYSIWKTDVYKRFWKTFYIYTDSDVVIDEICPEKFISLLVSIFKKYPLCQKVGFGIRIDDLPDYFDNKEKVISHESQFWEKKVRSYKNCDIYYADIDTTFALYGPYCKGGCNRNKIMIRTGFPYVIRHLPWYLDTRNLSAEEVYYVRSCCQPTHWTNSTRINSLTTKQEC